LNDSGSEFQVWFLKEQNPSFQINAGIASLNSAFFLSLVWFFGSMQKRALSYLIPNATNKFIFERVKAAEM
jgi:hypothetical protein